MISAFFCAPLGKGNVRKRLSRSIATGILAYGPKEAIGAQTILRWSRCRRLPHRNSTVCRNLQSAPALKKCPGLTSRAQAHDSRDGLPT